jgi:maltose-binding protein MalE
MASMLKVFVALYFVVVVVVVVVVFVVVIIVTATTTTTILISEFSPKQLTLWICTPEYTF